MQSLKVKGIVCFARQGDYFILNKQKILVSKRCRLTLWKHWSSYFATRRSTLSPVKICGHHNANCSVNIPQPRAAAALHRRNLKTKLYLFHSNPSRKSAESALQTELSWKRWLCGVLVWTKNILIAEFFKNDGVPTIIWFQCPSLKQKDCCVFNLSGVAWNRKHFHVFRAMKTVVFKFLRLGLRHISLKSLAFPC